MTFRGAEGKRDSRGTRKRGEDPKPYFGQRCFAKLRRKQVYHGEQRVVRRPKRRDPPDIIRVKILFTSYCRGLRPLARPGIKPSCPLRRCGDRRNCGGTASELGFLFFRRPCGRSGRCGHRSRSPRRDPYFNRMATVPAASCSPRSILITGKGPGGVTMSTETSVPFPSFPYAPLTPLLDTLQRGAHRFTTL